MFDLRYHVASLAAVFLALIIGILVGVGISDRGLVDKAKNGLLEQRVAKLQTRLDEASQRSSAATREREAAKTFVNEAYPVLIRNRLHGKKIAVVFVGSAGGGVRSAIDQALTDAGAQQLRLRALKVPIELQQIDAALSSVPDTREYAGRSHLESLGKALGQELVGGGETPLWSTLTDALVEERAGGSKQAADGVVVVRTAGPQRDGTSRFLLGLYEGLAGAGVPAIGVETTDTSNSAVAVYRAGGLSSVDDVDTPTGRLALVLLLAAAPSGQYGLRPSAHQGSLPPIRKTVGAGG
jgi:Copper transport outer membrane protein, MctB